MADSDDKAPRTIPVRLQDIADRCGVSRATVSRVLRGDEQHASEETRRQIHQAAADMGYDPSVYHAARRLVLSRAGESPLNYVVAMIHGPKPATLVYEIPYYFRLKMGVSEGLSSRGFAELQLFSQEHSLGAAKRLFARGDVDGVISNWEPPDSAALIEQLRVIPLFGQRPIVVLIQAIPGASAVVADDAQGAHDALSHLLELGHRHVLLPWERGARLQPAHGQRETGCRQACREYGLEPDAHLHFLDWNYLEDPRTDLALYLQQHPEITAIFASNDAGAVVIHEALTSVGKRVPEDYSLVGFDDAQALPDR
ncbi:MAG: LacI family transcriptional regulator, partial [candidate division WS1 bacterium]|nr:LacI family transcriptional regulator [candidate division WS1 bacterium]